MSVSSLAEVVEVRFSLVRNQSCVGKRFIAKFNLGAASFMFIFSRDEGISRGPWVAWWYLSLQYQDLVELMSNNRGRGNTAGAAGCPQVFIPASLELGWKLSNELMSKIGDEGILQAPWAVLGYLSPH